MARDENMPFPLGQTYFGGDSTIVDVTVGTALEGQEFIIEDDDLSNGTIGANVNRSARRRKVRVVRNMASATLNASEVAKVQLSGTVAGQIAGQVNGLVASAADKGFPVDEFLGAGCLQYDLCYVVIDGLAKVKTDSAGTTTLAVGDVAVPGATTTGRVVKQDATTTGAALFNQIQNAIGRCAVAVAANSTVFTVDVGATHR
jgi:hypothetical protein